MTPMDLFIWGFVVLGIMAVLIAIELFAFDDSEDTVAAWMITAGLGSFLWLVLWAGAIVLWLISL